ncbi:MAG: nickel insertion protein, partial [Thermodesulfobacteriota bacterium]|nr:nickel insertion protein [Thermodesulfobacteriota bacterium]
MTVIAYADCPAGAAGDMILAAFLDLGLPLEHLKNELTKLDLTGYELETRIETRQSLAGRCFKVIVAPQDQHRRFTDIQSLILGSGLSQAVKDKALAVFETLAKAEGRMHNVRPDLVHFHEVGAVDSI